MSQRFVDDHFLRSIRAILRGEMSSGAHLHAHSLEVVGADEIDANIWFFPSLKCWRLFKSNQVRSVQYRARKQAVDL